MKRYEHTGADSTEETHSPHGPIDTAIELVDGHVLREQGLAVPYDQVELGRVALSHSDWSVRAAALHHMTDQGVLARVAISDESRIVRHTAARRLTDQYRLAEVYLDTQDVLVSDEVAKRLTDPCAISDILLRRHQACPSWHLSRFVSLVDDSEVFKQLALSDHVQAQICLGNLPLDLLSRVVDRDTLAHLAVNSLYDEIRSAALELLHDESMLVAVLFKGVVKNAGDSSWLYHSILPRLTEASLIAEVVVNAKPGAIEQAGGVHSNRTTASYFSTNLASPLLKGEAIRRRVLESLRGDEDALGKVATQAADPRFRCGAVALLSDQRVLTVLVAQDADISVRYAACSQLTEQTALAEIARSHTDATLRAKATERILDTVLLATIASTDAEGAVRYAAVGRLTDQSLLRHYALVDAEAMVRAAAIKRLTDVPTLQSIASTYDWYAHLHARAAERLEELGLPKTATSALRAVTTGAPTYVREGLEDSSAVEGRAAGSAPMDSRPLVSDRTTNGSKWKGRLMLAALIAFVLWMVVNADQYDDGVCRYGGNGAEWGC